VITFLSVGQGDSALVEFPGGKRMIVDGGIASEGYQDAGRRHVLPFLGYRRVGRLDFAVASHGQADHYGGLYSVVRELPPEELWIGPEVGCEAEGYANLLDLCVEEDIPVRRLCQGMEVSEINGVQVEVLNPPCDRHGVTEGYADCSRLVNNRSLVLRLTFGSVRVLLTGDIEGQAEEELLANRERVRALLLKVPHHGSPRSSTESFLEAVAPAAAVVSAGYGNRFGFPKEAVVRRYRERGILLYRTDHDGAVRFRTDGRSLWIETFSRAAGSKVSRTCSSAGGGEGQR
jgi:competence protein ComEC